MRLPFIEKHDCCKQAITLIDPAKACWLLDECKAGPTALHCQIGAGSFPASQTDQTELQGLEQPQERPKAA